MTALREVIITHIVLDLQGLRKLQMSCSVDSPISNADSPCSKLRLGHYEYYIDHDASPPCRRVYALGGKYYF
jgi:hypothetical protein